MDLMIIGKFIQERRKSKNLTQSELATKINVSEKTISKWECGKGFPDASLILPLCKELEIEANELLCGKKLLEKDYKNNAENNLINLLAEKRENKKKLILMSIISVIIVISSMSLLLVAGLVEMENYLRIIIIVTSLIILFSCIIMACFIDINIGSFECPNCKNRFNPSMTEYILAPHTITRRKLKCPHCGKTSCCKKRLIK